MGFRWPLLLVSIILFLSATALSPLNIEQGGGGNRDFGRLILHGVERIQARDGSVDLRLSRLQRQGDPDTMLYLDFEQGPAPLLRDQASNYRVEQSSYIDTADSRAGRLAALFNRRENRIAIRSPEELWPGAGVVNDFSMEMWLKPVYFGRSDIVLRKATLLDGQRRGLEISFLEGRLQIDLIRLFEGPGGARYSARLNSDHSLPLRQWSHIALAYRAASGELVLYLNGREEDRFVAAGAQGVMPMSFHPEDRSSIVLGDSYAGLIDEFRLVDRFLAEGEIQASIFPAAEIDEGDGTYAQQSGEVISDVLSSADHIPAASALLSFRSREPTGGAIAYFVRTSMERFAADTPERQLPWRRLSRSQAELQNFRYLQWKAKLRANPSGSESPVLESVALDYSPRRAPLPPLQVQLLPELSGPLRVCLQWEASASEAVQRGGYRIYYGYRSGDYSGHIDRQPADGGPAAIRSPQALLSLTASERDEQIRRPALIRTRLANKMRLIIDNDLIAYNTPRNPAFPRPPFLAADRSYYFAISAVDDRGVESQLSNEVVVVLRAPGDIL
ncbi:MAG: LamG domain-containing protein [Leptospirales bacterium]|nr:LamG domain-containing protein [Leptospirales bacterium]